MLKDKISSTEEININECLEISGGCSSDKSIFFRIGCWVAEVMNNAKGEGGLGNWPRNGYYF